MKRIVFFAVLSVLVSGAFAQTSLKVAATPEPHAAILNLVKDDLKAQGITLQVIEMTDYPTLNEVLEAGDIDANFYQHLPYMESFNKEKGTHLAAVAGVHVEPFALYSKKVKSIKDFKKKAVIAIPNDPTNEARALLLLQESGLIELRKDAGIDATPIDIVKNPLKLKFREIEGPSLPRVLNDVDGAVINGNYALPAGLSAKKDGLFVEGSSSPYVNYIVVKKGNEKLPKITALVMALQSDKVKNYINKTYPNGEVVAAF